MKLNKQAFGLGMIALLVMTSTSAFAVSSNHEAALLNRQDAATIQSAVQPVSTIDAVILSSATVPATSAETSAAAMATNEEGSAVDESSGIAATATISATLIQGNAAVQFSAEDDGL